METSLPDHKPDLKDFSTSGTALDMRPSDSFLASGFSQVRPNVNYWNWILKNLYDWVKHFNSSLIPGFSVHYLYQTNRELYAIPFPLELDDEKGSIEVYKRETETIGGAGGTSHSVDSAVSTRSAGQSFNQDQKTDSPLTNTFTPDDSALSTPPLRQVQIIYYDDGTTSRPFVRVFFGSLSEARLGFAKIATLNYQSLTDQGPSASLMRPFTEMAALHVRIIESNANLYRLFPILKYNSTTTISGAGDPYKDWEYFRALIRMVDLAGGTLYLYMAVNKANSDSGNNIIWAIQNRHLSNSSVKSISDFQKRASAYTLAEVERDMSDKYLICYTDENKIIFYNNSEKEFEVEAYPTLNGNLQPNINPVRKYGRTFSKNGFLLIRLSYNRVAEASVSTTSTSTTVTFDIYNPLGANGFTLTGATRIARKTTTIARGNLTNIYYNNDHVYLFFSDRYYRFPKSALLASSAAMITSALAGTHSLSRSLPRPTSLTSDTNLNYVNERIDIDDRYLYIAARGGSSGSYDFTIRAYDLNSNLSRVQSGDISVNNTNLNNYTNGIGVYGAFTNEAHFGIRTTPEKTILILSVYGYINSSTTGAIRSISIPISTYGWGFIDIGESLIGRAIAPVVNTAGTVENLRYIGLANAFSTVMAGSFTSRSDRDLTAPLTFKLNGYEWAGGTLTLYFDKTVSASDFNRFVIQRGTSEILALLASAATFGDKTASWPVTNNPIMTAGTYRFIFETSATGLMAYTYKLISGSNYQLERYTENRYIKFRSAASLNANDNLFIRRSS